MARLAISAFFFPDSSGPTSAAGASGNVLARVRTKGGSSNASTHYRRGTGHHYVTDGLGRHHNAERSRSNQGGGDRLERNPFGPGQGHSARALGKRSVRNRHSESKEGGLRHRRRVRER